MYDLNEFQRALPEASRAWLIAAMRQDDHIWQALLNPETPAWQQLKAAGLPPERWSPAALALNALGEAPDPAWLCSLKPIPGELRRRAAQAFERHTQPHSPLTPEIQTDLAQAGLLALALHERRRLLGSWNGLNADLHLAPLTTWRTPLACLFGMIPDPQDLLGVIFADGSHQEWNALALHVLLSNPLAPGQQVELLEKILSVEMLPFLQQLAVPRPGVARELAASLLAQKVEISSEQTALLAGLAAKPQIALDQLSQANENLRHQQAALNAQHADLLSRFALAAPATIQAQWRQAAEMDPDQPIYWASLAHALLDDGQNVEAANVLQISIAHHEHPDLLLALARLAYETGDKERARNLAIQALQAIEHGAARIAKGDLWLAPTIDHLALLSRILLEVGRPLLAAQAAELALQQRPANVTMLAILAQARFVAKDALAGMQALQLAILIAPENVPLRRQYAIRLENHGNWLTALVERQAIVEYAHPFISEEDETCSSTETVGDLQALANCAAHTGQPEIAIQACRRALKINPENGPLQAMFGEALTQLGNEDAAREHFNLATLLSPGLPRPWLALAQDYRQREQPQKAIETLLAAVQAAPQTAEIYLALGKSYLEANAPSQALEALRRAASLSPESSAILLPLGQALHYLGYLEEARDVLEKAWHGANVDSSTVLAYTYAQVLLAFGHLQEALEPLRRIVDTSPTDPAPYLDYACTLLTLKQDLPQAIQTLEYVLQIAPQQVAARAFQAEALAASGDLPAALEAYQAALESELVHDETWRARLSLGLGQTALALQRTDTAIAALHEASQVNAQNPQVYRSLAEAYLQANLQQNALQAMRAVLHVSNDNADDLLWFADKAQQIADTHEHKTGKKESKPLAQTALREALEAIRQAIHLDTQHSMLYIRQAGLHIQLNEAENGRAALRSLLEIATARPVELHQAAQLLLDPLRDPASAIECLEKALMVSGSPEEFPSTCDLLSKLAEAHRQNGDAASALQSIERAIGNEEAGSQRLAPLRRAKAHLLLELGQTDDALAWIETTLIQQPEDAELHLLAAELLQKKGNLAVALKHTEKAIPLADFSARSQAAELARDLLKFEQARSYLQTANPGQVARTTGHILRAELALETDAEIDAAEALTQAIEKTPIENTATDPQLRGRILALQARLTLRRGDIPAAHDLYQQARDAFQSHKSPSGADLNTLYADAAAALDLGNWEHALERIRQAMKENQHQPYAAYKLVLILARRAETQRLCEATQAIAHAPGAVSIAPTAQREFERSSKLARTGLGDKGSPSSNELNRLTHWENRGRMAFQATNHQASREQPYQAINRLLTQIETAPDAAWQETRDFAAAALGAAYAKQPAHPAIVHYLLAKSAFQVGEIAAAEEAIGVALALWPDEPRWHALAGEIYLDMDNLLQACEHFEQAISLEPKRAAYHLLFGQTLLDLRSQHANPGELELRAQQAFQQAVELDPKQPEAWYALAHAQMCAGNLAQAANSAERATQLLPEEPEYLLLRAQIALRNNRPDDAFNDAQTALKLRPDHHTALLLAARALQALNRSAEALALLDQSNIQRQPANAHIQPGSEPAAANRGKQSPQKLLVLKLERLNALAQATGPQAALPEALELRENYPNEPVVLAGLAHIQAQSGECDAAIATAQAALKMSKAADTQPSILTLRHTEQADLHHLLGDLLRRSGQLDQAVYHLNQAVQLDAQFLDAYLKLGQAQQERRQYRQALVAYQNAIDIAPQDPRPYLQAGLAFKDGKNYLEAENMLRQAAQLAPKDVTIRRQLAAVVALNLVHNRRKDSQSIEVQIPRESIPVPYE